MGANAPPSWRALTDPDTSAAEGDGTHSYFPHRFSDEARPGAFWDWFASTPALDSLTIQFAERMVQSMRLGQGTAPDFLNVSLSATDRVGHAYSPLSREQLDNLLRLDRELGAFFGFLDERVGKGRWVVALTADHGAPESPEDRAASGAYGHRATHAEHALMDSMRAEADRQRDDPAMRARLISALGHLPFVSHAWTYDSLMTTASADSFALLARRSIYPGRAGGEFGREGIEVQFVDGFLDRERGIDHGSPYWHDRHVPLIFLGDHISPASDSTPVATVDLAPTFARMIEVPFPGDLDGHPLTSVVAHYPGTRAPTHFTRSIFTGCSRGTGSPCSSFFAVIIASRPISRGFCAIVAAMRPSRIALRASSCASKPTIVMSRVCPRRAHRLHGAERHDVVAGEDRAHVGMRLQNVLRDVERLIALPVRGLRRRRCSAPHTSRAPRGIRAAARRRSRGPESLEHRDVPLPRASRARNSPAIRPPSTLSEPMNVATCPPACCSVAESTRVSTTTTGIFAAFALRIAGTISREPLGTSTSTFTWS